MIGRLQHTANRVLALLTCLLLIAAQLALPLSALATAVDTTGIPGISVSYTTAEGNPSAITVWPAATGDAFGTVVYWGQITDMVNWPLDVAVSIDPMDTNGAFLSSDVLPFTCTQEATALDGSSFPVGQLDVFSDGDRSQLRGSYMLYLSTLPMPPVIPQETTGMVNVIYKDAANPDGAPLYTDSFPMNAGQQPVNATIREDFAAYTLSGESSQMVDVPAGGSVDVVFYLTPPAPVQQQGTVNVIYLNADNPDSAPLYTDSFPMDAGQQEIVASIPGDFADYTISGNSSQMVDVPAGGSVDVYFALKAPAAEVQQGTVNVYYMDEANPSGAPLYTDSFPMDAGQQSVNAVIREDFAGYTVSGEATQMVDVPAGGSVDVYFTLVKPSEPVPEEKPQPDTIINQNGTTNDGVNIRSLPQKSDSTKIRSISAGTPLYVYGSLTAEGETWYSVNVDGLDCYVVASFVDLVAVTGSIDVLYVDQNNTQFATDSVSLTEGSNTISPNGDKVPTGYTPNQAEPVTVTLNADGSKSRENVTFIYNRPASTGSIDVLYVDQNNTQFATDSVSLTEGSNTISPKAEKVPTGYTPISVEPVTVTLNADGSKSRENVTFTYTRPAVAGSIDVLYLDQNNTQFATDSVSLTEGSNTISPKAEKVPTGYTPISVEPVTVTLNADGSKSRENVTFTYTRPAVAGSIDVLYLDQSNNQFATDSVSLTEGSNTISPKAEKVPTGYTPISVEPVTVTLNADGSKSRENVTFTYTRPAVAGSIDVLYLDQSNNQFAIDSIPLKEGDNTIVPKAEKVPTGYTPVSVEPVTVTLNADGSKSRENVTFTYTAPQAIVTFSFVDTKNATIAPDSAAQLDASTSDFNEYIAKIDGYTYQSASASRVEVSGSTATPNHITFTYQQNVTEATLEVRYVDQIGQPVAGSPEYLPLKASDQPYTITPNKSRIPSGYSLSASSAASHSVTVGKDLVAKPNVVTFNLVSDSVRGTVSVVYMNTQTGQPITSENVSLRPGAQAVVPNEGVLPTGYKISSASPSSVNVTISDTGVATPAEVRFYYQPTTSNTYFGYAVTTGQTALRSSYSMADSAIKSTLPANTLLLVNGQTTQDNILWDSVQTVLGTTLSGVLPDSATRHITTAEADKMIAEYNRLHPTETAPPNQTTGYYITIYANVPLRTYTDAYSNARQWLPLDSVIYVYGQEYRDNVGWHKASYMKGNDSGYVQTSMVRKMTDAEVQKYINSNQNTAAPSTTGTAKPYDPYGPSSYGYVTSSSVNFRQTPNGSKIKALNRYAFALIIGSKEVNGVTWYYVNQSGVTGWIHGDYFHQLNLTELSSFLNSNEYRQGIINNSTTNNGSSGSGGSSSGSNSGSNSGGSTGTAKPGDITSVEDWNVGTWKNTGVTTQTSYAPFNPYATTTPSPSTSISPSASVEPTNTFVIGTMIPITYEDESKETQTNAAPWGLIAGAAVVLGGAGGVYAYALNQNKRRKAAAARAAASRKNGAGMGGQPPQPGAQARRAVAAPPLSGTQKNTPPQNNATTPPTAAPYGSTVKNPYSSGSITGNSAGGSGLGSMGSLGGASSAGYEVKKPSSPYDAGSSGLGASSPYGSASTGGYGTQADGMLGSDAGYTSPNAPKPPVSGGAESASTQRSNPYARPIGTVSQLPGSDPRAADADNTSPRRSTRMQRYHAAEDDQNNQN